MPKPFKLQSTRTLPANSDIVQHTDKPHVRLREKGRTVLFPLTKDGRKYLRPSKCWYFEYKDAAGTVRRKRGFTDLKATEQLAAEAERKASRVSVGLIDPAEEHARRPLTEHVAEYAAHLEAKGDTAEHVKKTCGLIRSLFAGGGFVFLRDMDTAKANDWLNARRRDGAAAELPAGVDGFTPAAAAELLGITRSAVGKALRRLGLTATGEGKARRIPRAAVGRSPRTGPRGSGRNSETTTFGPCAGSSAGW